MTPVEITRDDLAFLLTAVLPHVGTVATNRDWIGLSVDLYDDLLLAFATDGYTAGVAKAHCDSSGRLFDAYLTPKEARDLLAWVKPTRVAERNEVVRLLTAGTELHVATSPPREGSLTVGGTESQTLSQLGGVTTPATDSEASVCLDSGVWSLREAGQPLEAVWGLVEAAVKQMRRSELVVLQPKLLAKFSRAQREDETVHIYPAAAGDGSGFGAVVTVGDAFVGAVGGVKFSHRNNTALAQWGLVTDSEEIAA